MNRPLRIVVADDERDMREYLQEALPRLGHEVAAAVETGRQLVERCRILSPDLAILDIKMPDMDGIDAAQTINQGRPIPVILVSAHHDTDLLNRAKLENVMSYLVKPIKEADLQSAITLAMLRFQHFQVLAKEARDLRQALEDRKLIERAKGIVMRRVRVDEEEAFRRLQRLASNHNQRLVEVAQRVLAAEEVFNQMEKI